MIDVATFSFAGKKGDNQDSILVERNGDDFLLAIADGMGGKKSGGDASRIATETLSTAFKQEKNYDLPSMFRQAKDKIIEFAEVNSIDQMGTTLTACLIKNDKVTVAHTGDTRLYHLRSEGIISVTKDQTEVQKLIDDGVLSKKRAEKYHRRNVLLSALTNYTDYSLFETEFYVSSFDRLILLTDGAYELIKKVEIRDLSVMNSNISKFTDKLKEAIELKKIHDDYSLIACQVE